MSYENLPVFYISADPFRGHGVWYVYLSSAPPDVLPMGPENPESATPLPHNYPELRMLPGGMGGPWGPTEALWEPYGGPMGSPTGPHGGPTGPYWEPYRGPMLALWEALRGGYGGPMGPYGNSMGALRGPMGTLGGPKGRQRTP